MSRDRKTVTIVFVTLALSLSAGWESLAQNMFDALQGNRRVMQLGKGKKFKNYGTRQFQFAGGDGLAGNDVLLQFFAVAMPGSDAAFKGKGDAVVTHRCGSTDPTTGFFSQTLVHQATEPFDKAGYVNSAAVVTLPNPCDFVFMDVDLTGNARLTGPGHFLEQTIVRPAGEGDCVPAGTMLCLNDDRFQVEVDWATGGKSGSAVALPLSDESGTFFFFDPDNSEMLVKVLDGCSFNAHFWVFAAAATDVEYTLTVTDTQTGSSKAFGNPLGNAADAVVDTQAFATCP